MESTSAESGLQWISLYETGKIHKPGVYYDMPREEYHRDCSCSSSSIRNVLISPLDCWVNSAFNPDYEEEPTDAKDFGTAFHVRILEGKAAFDKQYAAELEVETLGDDVLKSGEQLRAKCGDMGLAKNGTLKEMSDRIIAVDPAIKCFAHIEAAYAKLHDGKTFLKAKAMRRIDLAARAIETTPELMEMLEGTEREVSVFWIDKETGVPMKARLDAFKPGLILDIKTFANQMGKPLTLAVTSTISQHQSGVQAITYKDGLLQALGHDSRFFFLFQESGAVPNILAHEYAPNGLVTENAYYTQAQILYRRGIALWKSCFDSFGEAPWLLPVRITVLEDTDFPAWHFN